MITVTVAGIEQDLAGLSDSWLHEQIRRRQNSGESVCVQVKVRTSEMHVGVSTGSCPVGVASSRQPNANERKILELWKHFELGGSDVNSGKLVAFLQRLRAFV
ncbi:hypothetical protein [Marinobacter salexigens]|uniref:Uncharacterized protein n=1 Tax=Marinobacter salexigens TaxID=1925763 RepID=A0ABS6A878_9GAMM|nr:hypothetical protein [Marinobacter salexigens]MBU2874288.1 hypothetical protein [Marinobacter salexigens]